MYILPICTSVMIILILIVIFSKKSINTRKTPFPIYINTLKYKHFKGKTYEVLLSGVLESDPSKVMVVYRSIKDDKVWIRDACEFHGYTDNNVKRFVLQQ